MKWQMSILSVKNFPSYLIKWCLFEVFLLFPHVMPLTSYHCRMPFCSCHFFFAKMFCTTAPHVPMADTQFCKVTAYILQNYCVQIWMYQGSRACFWWANLINLFCFSILAWSNWWWLGGNYRWPDYWIREAAQAEACIQHCILLTCITPERDSRGSSGWWITLAF